MFFDEIFLKIFHDNIFFVGIFAFLLALIAIVLIFRRHYIDGIGTLVALIIAGVFIYYWDGKITKEEVNIRMESESVIIHSSTQEKT